MYIIHVLYMHRWRHSYDLFKIIYGAFLIELEVYNMPFLVPLFLLDQVTIYRYMYRDGDIVMTCVKYYEECFSYRVESLQYAIFDTPGSLRSSYYLDKQ